MKRMQRRKGNEKDWKISFKYRREIKKFKNSSNKHCKKKKKKRKKSKFTQRKKKESAK
jgi:hypothetical protein